MQKYATDTRQQPSMRGGLAFLESGRDDLDNLVEIIMISRLETEKARNPYILEFEGKKPERIGTNYSNRPVCSILPSQLLATIHLAISHVVPLSSSMWLIQNGHSFPFSLYFEVWFFVCVDGGFWCCVACLGCVWLVFCVCAGVGFSYFVVCLVLGFFWSHMLVCICFLVLLVHFQDA